MLQSLIIREAQLDVFISDQVEAFVAKLVHFTRERRAGLVAEMSDAIVHGRVKSAVKAGMAIGLKLECSYLAYALLAIRLGPRFDQHPSIRRILSDPKTAPDNRISRLAEEISTAEWQEAARLSEEFLQKVLPMANGDPSTWIIVPYKDPQETITEAFGRMLQRMIQEALKEDAFLRRAQLAAVKSCPYAEKKRVKIKLQYLHHDGAPVSEAKYVLLGENGNQVAAGSLTAKGLAEVTVDEEDYYNYYFHDDYASKGPKYFNFFKPPECIANPNVNLGAGAVDRLIEKGTLKTRSLTVAHAQYVSVVDFAEFPTLGKLAQWTISNNTPHVLTDEKKRRQRLIGGTERLISLFRAYGNKKDRAKADWEALVFERMACTLGIQGLLIADLLFYLSIETEQLSFATVLELLNSRGKSNGVKWLRALKADMSDHIETIATSIRTICSQMGQELNKLATASTDKVSTKVQSNTKTFIGVLKQLGQDAAAEVEIILQPCIVTLTRIVSESTSYQRLGMAETVNTLKQRRRPLGEWTLKTETSWLEVKYEYSDGTPVPGAKYIVEEDVSSNAFKAEGFIDAEGFARVELPGEKKKYKFCFHDDPEFEISADKLLKVRAGALDDDILTDAIQRPAFLTDLFEWGDTDFISKDDFVATPTLRKLAHWAVMKQSPIDIPARDLNELLGILYTAMMNPVTDVKKMPLWTGLVFSRISCVFDNGRGAVLQVLLHHLGITATKIEISDLVKMLNSVGKGNAVKWLKNLNANWPGDAICTHIQGFLTRIQSCCQTIADANDAQVLEDTKARMKFLASNIGKVSTNAPSLVEQVLQQAKAKLAEILQESIEYKEDAVLLNRRSYRQQSSNLPDWSLVAPAKVKWFDVQYLYADGTPVLLPDVQVTGGTETPGLVPKLPGGFRHLSFAEGKTFDTFRFLHDPTLLLSDSHKCVVNPNKTIADLINAKSKPLAQGKKVLKFGALTPVCEVEQDYVKEPTIGRIVFNRVREKALHVTLHLAVEKEISTIFCFQLMYGADREWGTLAFLWLMTQQGEQGYLVSAVLGTIYRHRARNANANPLLVDIVKLINSFGKGNAVRWLEALKNRGEEIGNALKTSFVSMLESVRTDLAAIANPSGNEQTKNQFSSKDNREFATSITSGFRKQDAESAGDAIKVCIVTSCTALGQLLTDGNSGKDLALTPIVFFKRNTVKQQRLLPTDALLKLPAWIAVKYKHHDKKDVDEASFVFKVQGAPNELKRGVLTKTGFAFIPNPPLGAVLEFYFRNESSVDDTFKFKDEYKTKTSFAVPGSVSDQAARGQNNRNFWIFQAPTYHRFEWGEDHSVRLRTIDPFVERPSIGKIAWWCVANATARSMGANETRDVDEMTRLLRALIEGGTAGITDVAPAWFCADNAEQSDRLWTAIVFNRVGVTTGVPALPADQGLIRRAILEYIEFEVDLGTLTPNNYAQEIKPLIERLNKIGSGPAVKWLRLLKAQLNNLRDSVRTNVRDLLDSVRNELFDLHGNVTAVQAAVTPYGERLLAIRNNHVQPQVDAVFLRFSQKLALMVPDAGGVVRPYIFTGTINKINECSQIAVEFPQCRYTHITPIAWDLANPASIEVGYEYADGTPVPSATFTLYQKGGGQVAQQAAQPGRCAFVVNNASGDYEFTVENDSPGALFNLAIPWANPYRALDGNNAAHTYLTDSIADNHFAGKNQLIWGDTNIGTLVNFQAAPTLNRMLADSVVAGCALVSSANDVRDITLSISDLLQNQASRNVSEQWFRLGTVLVGTIANTGSLQKGILIYSYNGSIHDTDHLLALTNWAGQIHAVHWLENEVVPKNYIATVDGTLTTILNRFKTSIATIRSEADTTKVSALLNGFLKDRVIDQIDALLALSNGKFTTCFDTAVNRVQGHLANGNFPRRHACGPGRTIYRQRDVDDFLECGFPLTANRKGVLISLAEADITDHAAFLNPDQDTQDELNAFDGDTRGMQAKALAKRLATMNDNDFKAKFNQLKTDPNWTVNSDNIIEHSDGTLIRYKPFGDAHQRPPCPTYSIEVVKEHYIPPQNDEPLNRAAFKVDAYGRAVPKKPTDTNARGVDAEERAYYKDLIMRAGHKSLLF